MHEAVFKKGNCTLALNVIGQKCFRNSRDDRQVGLVSAFSYVKYDTEH